MLNSVNEKIHQPLFQILWSLIDDSIPARKVVFSNKNQICMYTSSPRKAVGDIMPVLLATTMAIPKHCWSL